MMDCVLDLDGHEVFYHSGLRLQHQDPFCGNIHCDGNYCMSCFPCRNFLLIGLLLVLFEVC